MVDTYHSDQEKFYYVPEGSFGVVPASPAMLGHSCSSLDPDINPNNIKVSGTGSIDLVALKRGLRQPTLKIKYPIPSAAPLPIPQTTVFVGYFKTSRLTNSLSSAANTDSW
jgi:hypothetical protein